MCNLHMEGSANYCGDPYLMGHPCVSDLSSGDSHFVVNDLATNNHTGLMYTIFIFLLTSSSNLSINQPKSPIIFLYFCNESINKFNVMLRSNSLHPFSGFTYHVTDKDLKDWFLGYSDRVRGELLSKAMIH